MAANCDPKNVNTQIFKKIILFDFYSSLINAFYHGWELTLVILAAMPVLMFATAIIAGSQTALTEKEMSAYGKAGAIGIKTVLYTVSKKSFRSFICTL